MTISMFFIILGLCCAVASASSIIGLPFEKMSFYDKTKDFSCLDGSQSIPFMYVNDDYCDCDDGSDEPGTSACDNSLFYCENKHHEPQYLLSSRVNDGVCDCCDGTDEWNNEEVSCPNTCVELGEKMREELRKLQEAEELGFKKRSDYSNQGRQKREEYERDLSTLESDLGVVSSEVDVLRKAKEEAEEPESRMKEEHQKQWEEEKTMREEENRKKEALKVFVNLDRDSNGMLTVAEVMDTKELDDDGDGVVSSEEAETYLDGDQPISFSTFLEKSWDVVSAKLKEEPNENNRDEDDPNDDPDNDPDGDDPDDDPDNDPDNDDDDDDDDDGETLEMPPYDEETQRAIEIADAARKSFKEAEDRKKNLETQKSELEKYLNIRFGYNHEFSPLFEQCYEYTDREYVYKLCMFKKITQKSKSGGKETSLGSWENWQGPSVDSYSIMKYTKGERCWNGPDRSTTVYLKCGVEDKIVSASEPNKCEYAMEFLTPAVCQGKVKSKHNLRVEL